MDRELPPPPALTVSLPDASELEQLQQGASLDQLELKSPGTSPLLTAHVFPPNYKRLQLKAARVIVQIKAILIENGRDRSYIDEITRAYDAATASGDQQLSVSTSEREKVAFQNFVRDVLQPIFHLSPPGIKALIQEDVASLVEYIPGSSTTEFPLAGNLSRIDTASFNHYDISAEEAELGISNSASPMQSTPGVGLTIERPSSPKFRRSSRSSVVVAGPGLSFSPVQHDKISPTHGNDTQQQIPVDYSDLGQKVLHIVDWIRSTLIDRGLTDDCQDIDEITTLYWAMDDDQEVYALPESEREKEMFSKSVRELLQPVFRSVPLDVKQTVFGDVIALHVLGDVDRSGLYSDETDGSSAFQDSSAQSSIKQRQSLSTEYTIPDVGGNTPLSLITVRKVPQPPPVPALPSWYHASDSQIPTVDENKNRLQTQSEALSYIYGQVDADNTDNDSFEGPAPTSLTYHSLPVPQRHQSARKTTAFDQLGPVVGQDTVERRRNVHKPSKVSLNSDDDPVTTSYGVGLDPTARLLMDITYQPTKVTPPKSVVADNLALVLHRAVADYTTQEKAEHSISQGEYVLVLAMQINRGPLNGWCLVKPLGDSESAVRDSKGWVPGAYLEKLEAADAKDFMLTEKYSKLGFLADLMDACELGQPKSREYISTMEVVTFPRPGTLGYDTYNEAKFGTYTPILSPPAAAPGKHSSHGGYQKPSPGYSSFTPNFSGAAPMSQYHASPQWFSMSQYSSPPPQQGVSAISEGPETGNYTYISPPPQGIPASLYTPTPGPSYSGYPYTTYTPNYLSSPPTQGQYTYTPLLSEDVHQTFVGPFGPGKILSGISIARPDVLGWFMQRIPILRSRKQEFLLPFHVEAVELDASDGSDQLSNMLNSCTLSTETSDKILKNIFGNRLCSPRYRGIVGVYISALSRSLFDAIQSDHVPVSKHHHGNLFVAILIYIIERLNPTATMGELAQSKSFISVYRQLPEPMELADTTFRPQTPVKRPKVHRNTDDNEPVELWKTLANADDKGDSDAAPGLTEQRQAYDWLRFAIDRLFLIDLRSPEMLYEDESNGDKPIEELCTSFLPAGAGFHVAPTVITSVELTASMLCEWRGIRFEWTNTLADHLEYNSELGVVKIYSEVAPCFLHDIAKSDSSLCKTGMVQHHRNLVEIAHTYRLLFGADARSYDCFVQLDVDNRSRTYFDFRTLPLCDRQPRTQYNVSTDFSIYGERIIALNTLLKPTGLKILWKDKRNSLQWYTFWAVVFIGGLGIILAFTQIALGAIQAWASMQALKASGRL